MTFDNGPSSRYSGGMTHVVAVASLAVLGLFSMGAATQASAQQAAPGKSAMGKASSQPQPGQQTFASCEEASKALIAAIQKNDEAALLKILGPNAKEIISSGDDAEDQSDRAQIAQKYQQMHRLVMEPDGSTTLYVGAENWPTPIPLMHKGSAWYFDTAAGKQQILYRRIGKNELMAIQVCGTLVDAQKEYYAQPHDGDKDQQYAQKLYSDPGKRNGLYWETSAGETASPIGPLVAHAADSDIASPMHQPFMGYYFRVLKEEGSKRGRSYIVDGKMTRGFAFVAYPAEYRSSGVMTFVVNQDGIVYEKDLGPRTTEIVKTLTRYDRDATWRKAD